MATYRLVPHPDHPPLTASEVQVKVLAGIAHVLLTYSVLRADKVLPQPCLAAKRTDGLWRTTCFELFLRLDDRRYVEFNFSPSTRWAAYGFSDYRAGMSPLPCDVDPVIERLHDGIEVDCDLGGLPSGALAMSLSAVIEEEGGVKSFWALTHAPGPPDFHNPACFTARLPAPPRA